jgi:hypothetical protein
MVAGVIREDMVVFEYIPDQNHTPGSKRPIPYDPNSGGEFRDGSADPSSDEIIIELISGQSFRARLTFRMAMDVARADGSLSKAEGLTPSLPLFPPPGLHPASAHSARRPEPAQACLRHHHPRPWPRRE